jgi:ATP-dependent phosphofructokinase / diphosphate-dependent phosphofructokinase
MTDKKTIGVLTSGGDCAGLNAVIRAVTEHATATYGWRVLGLRQGHLGLLETPPEVIDLKETEVTHDLLRSGGTILGTTNKNDPFHIIGPDGVAEDRSDDVIAAVKSLGIDALVVIGGDGSMRLFNQLFEKGQLRWVGVPKTIDNDVPGTDFTVGFFTAVEVVAEALDRLSSTAASHRRIMVLEVMGRDSGFIALFGGIAGGADVILAPEVPYDMAALTSHVTRITAGRPNPVLVVVAEGVKPPTSGSVPAGTSIGGRIARELQDRTGIDARCTVLGHVQRGGIPAPFDRLLATSFGVHAVDLLAAGADTRLVGWRGGAVVDVPMSDVVKGPRKVSHDSPLLKTAIATDIYIGEHR